MSRNVARTLLLSIVVVPLTALFVHAQSQKMIPEPIEWTWEVRPENPQAQLPNVLLVGDSITRNYYPDVTKDLASKANVYLFSTSASVGDPRLPAQLKEFIELEHVKFRVIHFNNGMHGWGYTEAEYAAAFPGFIQALRKDAPGAKLIWANVTPVKKDDPAWTSNARIDARNAITASIVKQQKIPLDDQHALILQHPDLYSDNIHPNKEASSIQAQQVAAGIEKLL